MFKTLLCAMRDLWLMNDMKEIDFKRSHVGWIQLLIITVIRSLLLLKTIGKLKINKNCLLGDFEELAQLQWNSRQIAIEG